MRSFKNFIAEDTEQLDELSTSTLQSYKSKAQDQRRDAKRQRQNAKTDEKQARQDYYRHTLKPKGDKRKMRGNYNKTKNDLVNKEQDAMKRGKAADALSKKRASGIRAANRRLNKEDTQISELSSKTVDRYADKAFADKKTQTQRATDALRKGAMTHDNKQTKKAMDHTRKAHNRVKGINMANSKLTKFGNAKVKAT